MIAKFLENIDKKHADKIKAYLKVENDCVYIVNGEYKYEVANFKSRLFYIASGLNEIIDMFYNKLSNKQ